MEDPSQAIISCMLNAVCSRYPWQLGELPCRRLPATAFRGQKSALCRRRLIVSACIVSTTRLKRMDDVDGEARQAGRQASKKNKKECRLE